MSSTYSPNLKLELIAPGEQSGVWGTTTNANIGTALEEAIVGLAIVTFVDADVTLTLTNSNASQAGRAFALRLEGTATTGRNLIVPSVNKTYIVRNLTNQTITIKTASGSGVALPSGGKFFVYCNAVDVIDVIGYLPSLTLPLTGLLKGNGSATPLTTATANVDYLTPTLGNTAVGGFKTAVFHQQGVISQTSGAITIDWSAAQNQKQTEPTGNISYTFVAPPGPCHLQLLVDSDASSVAYTYTWPANVVWMGAVWLSTANKRAIVTFWYDGTNYYGMGVNQV